MEILVSSGEMVLMQTAKAEMQGHNNSEREQVRILPNSGSQRTYTKPSSNQSPYIFTLVQ